MKKLVWALLFLAVIFSCKEKPAESPEAPVPADDHPFEWNKIHDEWIIALKNDNAFPPETAWSLFLYYSWNGKDDALPLDLTVSGNSGTGSKVNGSFDFFPKEINIQNYKETFIAFHSEQWKTLPKKITINGAGNDLTVLDIKCEFRSGGSGPLAADPGTILHYPKSFWRKRSYEIFSHNLYPDILYLVSGSFKAQSIFLKRLAFFTEKKGFTGRLAHDEEIADLRDWFAHDYRARDLAAFFELARKENFPLNPGEIYLRELLLAHGIVRDEGGRYSEGKGSLLGFSVESADRLPVYYVHETIHGLEFILSGLGDIFLDFFNSLSGHEKAFMRDALFYRGYNVIKDKQLLASETAAYLLQQKPEETDEYFLKYIFSWYLSYNKDPDTDYSEEAYSDSVTEFLRKNPRIFGKRSTALQKEFRAFTGLSAENFYDLLPKDRSL